MRGARHGSAWEVPGRGRGMFDAVSACRVDVEPSVTVCDERAGRFQRRAVSVRRCASPRSNRPRTMAR
eukprot:3300044-Prymnesium_polylepis.1